MDPVYAGTIAGLTLLMTGVLCGFGIYIYKECRTPVEQEYSRV